MFVSSAWSKTHCSELVCRDFLLAFGNGVEKQVLQTGQDACLSSPGENKKKKTKQE